MTQKEVTKDLAAQMDAAGKRFKEVGAALKTEMANRTRSDVSAAQFAVGDELFVPNDDKYLFKSMFNSNAAYGITVACKTAAGVLCSKNLYFSALNRSVPEYNQAGVATGNVVYATENGTLDPADTNKRDVYDAANGCATDLEVYEAFKGKSIKVLKKLPVKAARYQAGVPVGCRDREIPVFTFA